uniref:Putative secreted protein n=1 Tax=Ixodes ricinus TaxID=34613 RepID=A0A6B0UL17_IXORI
MGRLLSAWVVTTVTPWCPATLARVGVEAAEAEVPTMVRTFWDGLAPGLVWMVMAWAPLGRSPWAGRATICWVPAVPVPCSWMVLPARVLAGMVRALVPRDAGIVMVMGEVLLVS